MSADLPLPTLLSQVLVAFTIEFDNEFEHRMPHRTTNQGGAGKGPWLVSLVMWANCMQFVSEEGLSVRELERLARTKTNLNGMQRWGYIVVEPDPLDSRPRPPRSTWLIRATGKGQKAQEMWRPLFNVIETRWQERFGREIIAQLRQVLHAIVSQMRLDLPDCLPILGYGLYSKAPTQAPGKRERDADLTLAALLSKVLLAFTLEFERQSDLSLALSANVLRVLNADGVKARDLPVLAGVSKEAIRMAMGLLEKYGLATVGPDETNTRTKLVRLSAKGEKAKVAYRQLINSIEDHWKARFSEETIKALGQPLGTLVGEPTASSSPLFRGLEPYPDGWRASVQKPATMPHFPMVLHRGGFPDGG